MSRVGLLSSKKGGISPMVIQIIGGVIVLAVLVLLFTGLATPFLEFLTDFEAVKNFDRMMHTMNRACKEGAETMAYVTLHTPGARIVYGIGLATNNVTLAIEDLPRKCPPRSEGWCVSTTEPSKAKIRNKCDDPGDLCWCLFKVWFTRDDANPPQYCTNYNANVFTIKKENETEIKEWCNQFAALVKDAEHIRQIKVLRCSNIADDLKCANETKFHVLPIIGDRAIAWFQARAVAGTGVWGGAMIMPQKFRMDSVSFERPISGKEFDMYLTIETHPDLTAKAGWPSNLYLSGGDCAGAL